MNQKGAVSILLAVLLLNLFLAISFAIFLPILKQIRMSREAGHSIVALYAADAGAEEILYKIRKETGGPCDEQDCQITKSLTSNDGLPSFATDFDFANTKVTSRGDFMLILRTISLTW